MEREKPGPEHDKMEAFAAAFGLAQKLALQMLRVGMKVSEVNALAESTSGLTRLLAVQRGILTLEYPADHPIHGILLVPLEVGLTYGDAIRKVEAEGYDLGVPCMFMVLCSNTDTAPREWWGKGVIFEDARIEFKSGSPPFHRRLRSGPGGTAYMPLRDSHTVEKNDFVAAWPRK